MLYFRQGRLEQVGVSGFKATLECPFFEIFVSTMYHDSVARERPGSAYLKLFYSTSTKGGFESRHVYLF